MSPLPSHTLADLAERFGLRLRGDGGRRIGGVATLANAGAGQLAFLSNGRYAAQLAATGAGAVILREEHLADCPVDALIAADPYVAYAKIAALYERQPAAAPGIHPTAVVDGTARIGAGASIGPCCV
ncbi:MAG TPA: LpxD N-terminal domain-containing protein, partial [Rhodanobacter sp.]